MSSNARSWRNVSGPRRRALARRIARSFWSKSSATRALVRRRMSGDKNRVRVGEVFRFALKQVLDFALPPRCAGCGTIVADLHSFCADCWTKVDFLGESGCSTCGIPLDATDADVQHTNAYVYSYINLSRAVTVTLGGSFDWFDADSSTESVLSIQSAWATPSST